MEDPRDERTVLYRLTLRNPFEIDLRALALFRILAGIAIIVDLLYTAPDARMFLSDWGVLPRNIYLERFAGPGTISFHLMSGQTWVQEILLLAAGLIAVALIIGWRTRAATWLSWAFLLSLHQRNPAIWQGGDLYFRMLLFWAGFLPLGARFSVDAARDLTISKQPPRIADMATLAFILQIVFLYWTSVAYKNSDDWKNGDAIFYTLSLFQYATPLGLWMLHFPRFLHLLTYGVVIVEILSPALLLVPIAPAVCRLVSMSLLGSFHLGLFLTMRLGPFPIMAVLSMVPLLPSFVFDRLAAFPSFELFGRSEWDRRRLGGLRTALLMDRVDVHSFESDRRLREVPADEGIALRTERETLWGEAAVAALAGASLPGRLVRRFAGQEGARTFARVLRSALTRIDARAEGAPLRAVSVRLSRIGAVICGVFIATVFYVNLYDFLPKKPFFHDAVVNFAFYTGVHQRWNMFTHPSLRAGGWYVMPGRLVNGSQVDVYTGTPVDWSRPRRAADWYGTEKRRRYLTNLSYPMYDDYRRYYGSYLCGQWNRTHDAAHQLQIFQMYFVTQWTTKTGETQRPDYLHLMDYWCVDKPTVPAPDAPPTS